MSNPLVTIAVPTYNGCADVERLLEGVSTQHAEGWSYEVLVIDSGSSDGTVELVRGRSDVRLHEIPNAEFGHGRTRQLAVQLARGRYVAFLTQDAVPADDRWLAELIAPFELGERIAAVFGRQVPHPDCCPAIKRDVIDMFRSFGTEHTLSVQVAQPHITSQAAQDSIRFFSDVNCAVRRSIVVDDVPYRDVDYAEDQVLGRDLIDAGYAKVYAPQAAVLHSHDLAPRAYFRRLHEEFHGLRESTGRTLEVSRRQLLLGTVRGSIADWRFIARDGDYGRRAKARWMLLTPWYNWARREAIRLSPKPVPALPRWARLAMAC